LRGGVAGELEHELDVGYVFLADLLGLGAGLSVVVAIREAAAARVGEGAVRGYAPVP